MSAPLKIGLLTHSVNPRGGVVHTLELATALHAAGHAVTVMAPALAGQGFFRALPCETLVIPVAPTPPRDLVEMVGRRIAAFTRCLSERVRRRSFDVLHAHDPIGANALADLCDLGSIHGFVRTVHHLEVFAAPQLMAWQTRGLQRATQVLCVSRSWRETLRREHGVQAEEVANGIDAARFSPVPQAGDAALATRLGVRAGAPVVLAVGGIEARKNTVRLLEAFMRLRGSFSGAQLVIAGGASLLDHAGYAGEFHALARQADLEIGAGRTIVLTGPLDDGAMPALYRLADVVAMPSLNEGFGLVVLEALASGVPVVVSRRAPFTDHLAEGDVHWADPTDAGAIAAALCDALAGRDAARLAASAARLVARFNWADSAARHVELYRAHLGRTAETC